MGNAARKPFRGDASDGVRIMKGTFTFAMPAHDTRSAEEMERAMASTFGFAFETLEVKEMVSGLTESERTERQNFITKMKAQWERAKQLSQDLNAALADVNRTIVEANSWAENVYNRLNEAYEALPEDDESGGSLQDFAEEYNINLYEVDTADIDWSDLPSSPDALDEFEKLPEAIEE